MGVLQAKQTQRNKNKTNTTQTSNKKKKTNKKKNNKSNKKNRQQTQDNNTDCCSKHPPPKELYRGIWSRPFQPSFCRKQGIGDPRKTAEGQNGSEKLESWKGPKIHISFFAYKTSGFVRLQKKNPPNRAGSNPKSVQKHAHYLEPDLRPREPKKAKYATF